MAGKSPLRRRALLIPLVEGEFVVDDFRRDEVSNNRGDPTLEEVDCSLDWLLIVRSMGSEMAAGLAIGSGTVLSISGNREGQQESSFAMRKSPSKLGEHVKLSYM